MKNECSIVWDLLPLYAENLLSEESAAFVEEHLKTCETCRGEYENIREPRKTPEPSDMKPLKTINRKIKQMKFRTIIMTALFVTAVLVSAFAVLDAPQYLPYSKDLITVEEAENNGLRFTFDPAVTDFSCEIQSYGEEGTFCDIEAWTSQWDQWFRKGKGSLSKTVYLQEADITVMYLPNNGTDDVCIYGQMDGGRMTLPRLALNFYFFLAVIALVLAAIFWVIVRKQAKPRLWVERIGLYPGAYLIAHSVIAGFKSGISYSMPRDFSLIVFLSILLYAGMLIALNILYTKREAKETGSTPVFE